MKLFNWKKTKKQPDKVILLHPGQTAIILTTPGQLELFQNALTDADTWNDTLYSETWKETIIIKN